MKFNLFVICTIFLAITISYTLAAPQWLGLNIPGIINLNRDQGYEGSGLGIDVLGGLVQVGVARNRLAPGGGVRVHVG